MKLGAVQYALLRALVTNHTWSRGCGWVWDTPGHTARMLDGLVRKGMARVTDQGMEWASYTPTPQGREYLTATPAPALRRRSIL